MTEMKDSLKITGSIRKQLFNSEGILIYDHTDHNLIVTIGKAFLASWLTALTQSTPFMSWIGLGTGATAPVIGNTDLQTPLPTRIQGTLTTPGSTNVWQNQVTFAPGVNTGSITEAGLFSTNWTSPTPAGTMFARQTFGVVNKGVGDTFILTWQVNFN
jgi:hypothetical protein